MCSQYRHLISFWLCFLWLPASLPCNLEDMQACHYHDELNKHSFNILFIDPYPEFILSCRRQKSLLDCAGSGEHTLGCSQGILLTIHALNNTHRAVCGDNIAAYNSSRPCILPLKSDVRKCFGTLFKATEGHCQELTEVRQCVQNKAKAKKECSSDDVRFLGRAIDSGLKPSADLYNCDKAIFGGGTEETTTQAETTPTTIHSTFKSTTHSTGTLAASTTPPSTENLQKRKVQVGAVAEAEASTEENSSSRRSLSGAAVLVVVLTLLSVRGCHSY
ncbi:hypothetical protein BsWGS_13866 [Bradybaena similaris]